MEEIQTRVTKIGLYVRMNVLVHNKTRFSIWRLDYTVNDMLNIYIDTTTRFLFAI
jgi:hypothetical protein